MPTYEYRCKDCGHELEIVQAFTDDALTTCPACEGALKKVFGNVGITFKGSGFYKTDSRRGAKANGEAKEGGATKAGDSGGDASSGTPDRAGSSNGKESGSGSGSGSGSESSSGSGAAKESSGKGSSSTPAAAPSTSS